MDNRAGKLSEEEKKAFLERFKKGWAEGYAKMSEEEKEAYEKERADL